MKILISNDDGYFADGLALLQNVLHKHEIITVVPDRNCSGYSNKISLDVPLYRRDIAKNFYAISGSPADCVHLATNGMLSDKFDLVISGVNDCVNLGDSTHYSGTIAAAIEGRGLPYMPVAISAFDLINYRDTVVRVLNLLIDAGQIFIPQTKPNCILNINIPACHFDQLKGCKVTKLGHSKRPEPVVRQLDPLPKEGYWLGKLYYGADTHEENNDYNAIDNNFVSITPIKLNMTDYDMLDRLTNIDFLKSK